MFPKWFLSMVLSVRTGSVMITEEEQKLLAEEGIHLPVDMPLTKVCTCLYT